MFIIIGEKRFIFRTDPKRFSGGGRLRNGWFLLRVSCRCKDEGKIFAEGREYT